MRNTVLTLQEAIDFLPDPAIVVNKNGEIVGCNNQVASVFGYNPQELVSKTLSMLLPEDNRNKLEGSLKQYLKNPVKKCLKAGRNQLGLKKNGKKIDVDISLAPFKLGEKELAIAIARDISEMKELDRHLLKKNEDLCMVNSQLERLGYVIAHDLKSPLLNVHAILSFMNREFSGPECASIQKYVKEIDEIILATMDMILGVTNYSRLGRQDRAETEIDLNIVVNEIRKLIKFPPNMKCHIVGTLPVIKGNKTKVLQVFLNLLSNAVKYNDKPNGLIEIKSTCGPNDCHISIADNGPGVPEKLRSRIFDLFGKGEIKKKGSQGIGLAVVKKIVEDHGGQIRVETSALGGADFIFNWPSA